MPETKNTQIDADVAQERPDYPHFLTTATEPLRALCELTALGASLPGLLATAPAGDGHPVLVLPGFVGSDLYTYVLRRFFTHLGYDARPWRLGRNTGSKEIIDRLARRFHRLVRTTDQPISIVGHSLGGIFARELARKYPESVRQVITLGSPFAMRSRHTTHPLVLRMFERSSKMSRTEIDLRVLEERLNPPPVHSTAIYSRYDGVVHWRTCREQPGPKSENIEVPASHLGMTIHPTILYVIADRLAQHPATWQKFRAPGTWRDRWFSPGSTV
jgi:hypothetical protein